MNSSCMAEAFSIACMLSFSMYSCCLNHLSTHKEIITHEEKAFRRYELFYKPCRILRSPGLWQVCLLSLESKLTWTSCPDMANSRERCPTMDTVTVSLANVSIDACF